MARQLRHNVEGGWYHITARGMWRKAIFEDDRAREKAGFIHEGPTAGQVKARLAALRAHPWSSYHAYAGYASKPDWLTCDRLQWRAGQVKGGGPEADYRRYIEDCLRQGAEEGVFARLTAALAIGGTSFVEGLRRKVPRKAGPETNARAWRRLLAFETVVAAVERIKGEPWKDFADRRGDWGRDLALYVARTRSGRTLGELGALSGMHADGVSKAVQRMRSRLSGDKKLNRILRKVMLALKEKG